MTNSATGTHHLYVSRRSAPFITLTVLMGDSASAHIGNDLHVVMTMGGKTGLWRNDVVIDHQQLSMAQLVGVVILRKAKVIVRIKPTVIGIPQVLVGVFYDHASLQK